jgi:hypothetical protein
MKVFLLNSSSHGKFILPNRGGKRNGFNHAPQPSVNGNGLLLSQSLGAGITNITDVTNSKPVDLTAIQTKLGKLTLGGGTGGVNNKKKSYINFRI